MNGMRMAGLLLVLGSIALAAGADIVADVRAASATRNFALADRQIQSYRGHARSAFLAGARHARR